MRHAIQIALKAHIAKIILLSMLHVGIAPVLADSASPALSGLSAISDAEIREAISGNLCRCTGYVQIMESIRQAADKVISGTKAGELHGK